MQYVIIDDKKIPQHPLDQAYELNEVKDYPNLAVLISEPYVVLDVDNMEQAAVLTKILIEKGIRTRILKTDRGCHFWFKTREPLPKNVVKGNTPLTIKVDVKSWGRKSLTTIKKNNVWREWLHYDEELDELPFWLRPIPVKKDLFGFKSGDGRDDGLYTYIIPLLKCKFSKIEIEIIFDLINKYIFKEPLLQREIDKMFKDNDIFDETLCFYDGRQFMHHEFAGWLKKTYPIKYFAGSLYLYNNNGLYVSGNSQIEEIMIKKIPKLTCNQRTEVIKYLELICNENIRKLDSTLINCLNGVVDIKEDKLLEHSEQIFTISQINAHYNPGIYDEHVDTFLNDISNNDKDIRALLEEVIGYCLLNDCRFQVAFILLGQGANGKSVFLKMLSRFLGTENVSSLSLEELGGRFATEQLVNKLANLGDDISGEFISDMSMFKKLVSGETVTVERKFQSKFQFNNTAKLIFSANTLPPVSDKSYGLFRRLLIIPFLNTFKPGMPNYDPNILTKLSTPRARSYLLDLGIRALKKLLVFEHFTPSKAVEELVENYVIDNNNCIQFLNTEPELEDVDINNVYRNYCLFCATNNTSPYKKSRLINEILIKLPMLRLKNTTRNGKFVQVFSKEKKR